MSNFSITINPLALAVHVILGGLFMLFILRNPGGAGQPLVRPPTGHLVRAGGHHP